MSNSAALEILERRLTEVERKANALVETINDLRAEDGLPPLPPFGSGRGGASSSVAGSAALTQIKPDTFYGKKLQTAVREYLEMRYAAAGGHSDPATPKDIYDAITKGGYQFEAKSAGIAIIGLRALLRKRTMFFHKLPNGTYGLTNWYPDAKKPKAQAEDDGGNDPDFVLEENGATTIRKTAADNEEEWVRSSKRNTTEPEKTDTAKEPKFVRRI